MKPYSLLLFLSLFAICHGRANTRDGEELFNRYRSAYAAGDFLGAQAPLDTLLLSARNLSEYHLALVLNSLGLVNWNLGKYEEASGYYQESLDICIENDAVSKKLRILVLNNMGLLATETGAYSRALEYFENAENAIARFPLKDSLYYANLSMVELNKALVYFSIEKYTDAVRLLHKSLEAKILHNLPYRGSVYFNLARSYKHLDKQDKSDLYFRLSISQWTKEHGAEHFELANVYREYGEFLAEQDKRYGAELYFQKAIDNYLANYGPWHPYTAICFNTISEVKYAQREYMEALEYAQKALISICPEFESQYIFNNPRDIESILDLRLLKVYRSKIKALTAYAEEVLTDHREKAEYLSFALETSEEAVNVLSRIQDAYLTQESRLFLTQNQKDIFIQGIEIALKLYVLTGDALYSEKAYGFAALGKTLEFNYEKRQKEILYLNSLQDSTAKDLISIRKDIEGYSYMIEHEQTRTKPDSSNLNTWKQSRFLLRREYDSLHEMVFGPEAKYKTRNNPFTPGLLQNLQANIGRNQCLVEYSLSGMNENACGKLYAFIITRKDLSIYCSDTDSSFYRDIELVQSSFRNYDPYHAHDSDWRGLESALTRLSKILIEPFTNKLGSKKLTIIPDDELSSVPFDALIQDSTYLIKNHEISLVPNSFMLEHKRVFRLKPPKVKVINQDYARPMEGGLDYLSLVEEETEAILNTLEGTVIPNTMTKPEILKEISEADMIHFALHLLPSNQHQSSSYMVLRQEDDSAFGNLLFDYEIDPLELSTPLVVMNACESGSGQFHRGEGMLSLSRSFLLAGARSVVSTLWPVDDKAGSTIIIKFYENLSRGNSKSKALRKAKLAYLEEAKPSFSHPYYWAGYQLMGDRSAVLIPGKLILAGFSGILILICMILWRRKQTRARA